MERKTVNRILVFDTADNGAEAVLAVLNGELNEELNEDKLSLSVERAVDRLSLLDALRRHDWDLLLMHVAVPDASLADALACIARYRRSTAVIVMSEGEPAFGDLCKFLEGGAAGMLALSMPRQAAGLLRRELERIAQLRAHALLRRENAELRERCDLLLDHSRDPVAYVHDGMHIYANEAYIKVFGCADMDEVACTPLIDLVAREDRGELKEKLKRLAQAGESGQEDQSASGTENAGVTPAAGGGRLVLRMRATHYEGEACLQIMVREGQQEERQLEQQEARREKPENARQAAQREKRTVRVPPTAAAVPAAADEAALAAAAQASTPPAAAAQTPAAQAAAAQTCAAQVGDAEPSASPDPDGLVCEPVISTADIEAEFHDLWPRLKGQEDLPAAEALASIEASGRGTEVDRWMLDQALEVIATLCARGQALQFAMPFSRESLRDRQFPAMLAARLKRSRLDPQTLIPSFSRQALLEDEARAKGVLEELRGQGLRVCLRGYRPEAELDNLLSSVRCHFVMLDAGLMPDKSAESRARVLSAIEFLHGARAKAIATGVDSAEHLRFLWEAGADLVQGKYFQAQPRPLQPESFSEEMEVLRNAV